MAAKDVKMFIDYTDELSHEAEFNLSESFVKHTDMYCICLQFLTTTDNMRLIQLH